jgi:hypothetical protein
VQTPRKRTAEESVVADLRFGFPGKNGALDANCCPHQRERLGGSVRELLRTITATWLQGGLPMTTKEKWLVAAWVVLGGPIILMGLAGFFIQATTPEPKRTIEQEAKERSEQQEQENARFMRGVSHEVQFQEERRRLSGR